MKVSYRGKAMIAVMTFAVVFWSVVGLVVNNV